MSCTLCSAPGALSQKGRGTQKRDEEWIFCFKGQGERGTGRQGEGSWNEGRHFQYSYYLYVGDSGTRGNGDKGRKIGMRDEHHTPMG